MAFEAKGLCFGPSVLVFEGDACERVVSAACDVLALDDGDWPPFRVRQGVFERFFTEGGWQDEAMPVRAMPIDAPAPALDAGAVRRAIGVDLRRMRCRDADDARLDGVVVEGDANHGFALRFDLIGTLLGDRLKEMQKSVALRWGPGDGDPHAFLVAALEELDLEPGATEWWY